MPIPPSILVTFNILLTLALPLSYIPLPTTAPCYALCHTLLSAMQLSHCIFIFGPQIPTPSESILQQINAGELHGSSAFIALSPLILVAMQWLCSVILFWKSTTWKSYTIFRIIALLHALIFILILLPSPGTTIADQIFNEFLYHFNIFCAPILLLLQVLFLSWELPPFEKGKMVMGLPFQTGKGMLMGLHADVLATVGGRLMWVGVGQGEGWYEEKFLAVNYLVGVVGWVVILCWRALKAEERRVEEESLYRDEEQAGGKTVLCDDLDKVDGERKGKN